MSSNEHRTCDREALSALSLGLLGDGQRRALEEHLQGCAACRDDLSWMEQVGHLLGTPAAGHPDPAELSAHAAGELEPPRQAELTGHLATCLPCRRLVQAALAGLEELHRLVDCSEAGVRPSPRAVHHVLTLPEPPALRAAAQDPGRHCPAPEDRRVLDEVPGGHRLVYYRRQAQGMLALFYPPGAAVEVERCALDGEALEPRLVSEGQIYALGSCGDLLRGRTVRICFSVDGEQRDLSWTLVRED